MSLTRRQLLIGVASTAALTLLPVRVNPKIAISLARCVY